MTVQVGVVQMGPWVEGTLFVGKLAMHHEAEHSDFFMALTVNLKVIFYVFLKHTKKHKITSAMVKDIFTLKTLNDCKLRHGLLIPFF